MTLDEIVTSLLMQENTASSRIAGRKLIKGWAEHQCKITARNVRHRACEIYYDAEDERDPDKRIMNIQFKEVTPFKEGSNE